MKSLLPVRIVFRIAAAYETLLGLLFIVAAPQVFQYTGITPPNHWGYVHFAAGVLVIFGFMFWQISRAPLENHLLIPYGILLKVCYVATVCWHWYHGDVPPMWKWFALADAIFAILFFWAMTRIEPAVDEKAHVTG